MWVTVAAKNALLLTRETNNRYGTLVTGSPRTMKRAELVTATVPIKENVVQAVLQFFSAETLYRKRWTPIKKSAKTANVYQSDMVFSETLCSD